MSHIGILMLGGTGTRLKPATVSVNKHLLPLYDKPIFFYSLSLLMLAKIKEIILIVNKEDINSYKKILKKGENLGIKLHFVIQKRPNGIPESLKIGEKLINKSDIILMLGDNFFYGENLPTRIINAMKDNKGATIFTYPVADPSDFGIVEYNNQKKPIKLLEKPKFTKSTSAITGLYILKNKAVKVSKTLRLSKRKELEIRDLLNFFLKTKTLKIEELGRGNGWFDTGTFDLLSETANFVSNIQKKQGLKIACLEEIALNNNWINKKNIKKSIKFYGNNDYSEYLKSLIKR